MAAPRGSDRVYRGGSKPKLTPEEVQILVDLVRANPLLSLDDLVGALRQAGISVSAPTIKKYLVEAGLTRTPLRRRGDRASQAATKEPAPKSYGYYAAHRDAGDRVRYPCGLTDHEWEHVAPLFAAPGRRGRPEKYPRRQMLDACIYVLRSGCSWRMLPKDFPPWTVVYRTFRRWHSRGLFETMHDRLRALWRTRLERTPEPSAAVLDSQSVATSPQGGPKGYDAAKKVKGRKRHLVTDTLGLMIPVLITTGAIQDREAAIPVMDLAKAKAPGIKRLYADSGYEGKRAQELGERYQIEVEIVRHPEHGRRTRWNHAQLPLFEPAKRFVVLPKRWVIERTHGWNDRPRRMNKDHDRNLEVSAAWIWLTEARLLLRRIVS